jgi:signal-transduction protein with cAMP-binding, CBS, and nucleotidyltransferase domain
MRVQDVMTDQVYKVSPDTTAEDAWNVMRMRRIHHLMVTEAGRIVGLLSARDFGGVKGARARELYTVADLMTTDVATITPKTPIRTAANVLRGHSIDCLIVVTGGRLVGIVTVADLLEQMGRGLNGGISSFTGGNSPGCHIPEIASA